MQLLGRDPAAIQLSEVAGRPLRTRTAIAMPVYNEDPRRVAAGLEAIWSSLAQESQRGAFDFFILSDTRDPGIAAAEEGMWHRFLARHRAAGRCSIAAVAIAATISGQYRRLRASLGRGL